MNPKVLIIAEAANPEWVSVPLIGWSMAVALRELVDTHIVTHVRNRDAFLRAGLKEGEFTVIDTERVAKPAWRAATWLRGGEGKGWTTVAAINALLYPYFEHLIWRRFGSAIREGEFNIVHRLTPLTPTIGSPIARRCKAYDVPFVIGPLNGGIPWPPGFTAERLKEREWLSYVRLAYKLWPGWQRSFESAAAVIVGSRHTATELPRAANARMFYMPENGIDPRRFALVADQTGKIPVKFSFIGRVVPYKGPDIVVDALLPLLRSGAAELDFIGDGPMLAQIRDLVHSSGVSHQVRFHGWLDHEEVQHVASSCHVFAFPSVREFGGGAVLEAMALGLVPMVVDYGGPGELVDNTRGYAIPLGSRQEIVLGMRTVAEEICSTPERLKPLALAARQWTMAHFTWAEKARMVAKIYDWVLHPSTTPPIWPFSGAAHPIRVPAPDLASTPNPGASTCG